MPRKDTVILNDYGRQPARGKGGRVSVNVTAEPLVHDFDEQKLARGPAEAIRDMVERSIRGIAENASRTTIAKRRRAGIMSSRLFNATGKLARGLTVAETTDGYETRAPANRLKDLPRAVLERLFDVAGIEPKEIVKDRKVKAAIEATTGDLIKKGRKR